MDNGKNIMSDAKKKSVLLLTSLLLLLTGIVSGTIAYLVVNTETVANTFELASVPNKVEEEFDGSVKKDVKIKNTGDVSSYIRASVVVTWVKMEDERPVPGQVYGELPVSGTDYQIEWTKDGWVTGADGYHYYLQPVAAEDVTRILFTSCQPIIDQTTGKTPNQPDGYNLSVEILSQSIQADGEDSNKAKPVVLAWGTENGGSVRSVKDDKSLDITTSGSGESNTEQSGISQSGSEQSATGE